jgi:hypothetical protein
MKNILIPLLALAMFTTSCDVNKKESAELPEVDIDVEEGNLPEYDVKWADIDVTTTTETVEVPKVVIVMEEEQVEVPVINVDMPNEDEKYEQELIVEAEVEGTEHDINIQQIRASDRRLYVIATLEALEQDIGDQKMRVQDQVTLNAPDLDVKYIIVGKKPNRIFNNKNMYVDTMDALPANVQDAQVIYTK